MAVDVECSHPNHASNSGYPGWTDVIGTVPDGETPPTDMICNGCAAADAEESLDDAKARCVQACKDWRDIKMNAPIDQGGISVEYPTSSGKFWPIAFTDQVMWDALNNAKNEISYPMTRRTWNERDKHSFASANEFGTFYALIRSAVLTEIDACDAALDNIEAATDIAGAEAAAAAYVGT